MKRDALGPRLLLSAIFKVYAILCSSPKCCATMIHYLSTDSAAGDRRQTIGVPKRAPNGVASSRTRQVIQSANGRTAFSVSGTAKKGTRKTCELDVATSNSVKNGDQSKFQQIGYLTQRLLWIDFHISPEKARSQDIVLLNIENFCGTISAGSLPISLTFCDQLAYFDGLPPGLMNALFIEMDSRAYARFAIVDESRLG